MDRLQPFLPQIQNLCQKHQVKQLWVFGSVLRKDFRQNSDIDFLYSLNHEHLTEEASNFHFFAFVEELQKLLGHPVDLIWPEGIKNPYFLDEINETKVLIYEEREQKNIPGLIRFEGFSGLSPFIFKGSPSVSFADQLH